MNIEKLVNKCNISNTMHIFNKSNLKKKASQSSIHKDYFILCYYIPNIPSTKIKI